MTATFICTEEHPFPQDGSVDAGAVILHPSAERVGVRDDGLVVIECPVCKFRWEM